MKDDKTLRPNEDRAKTELYNLLCDGYMAMQYGKESCIEVVKERLRHRLDSPSN